MPFLRFSRDRRGYETTTLMHAFRRRGRANPQILYWFRGPVEVKVGRAPLDEEAVRLLEEHHPDVDFDWPKILEPTSPALAQGRGREVAAAAPYEAAPRTSSPPRRGAPHGRIEDAPPPVEVAPPAAGVQRGDQARQARDEDEAAAPTARRRRRGKRGAARPDAGGAFGAEQAAFEFASPERPDVPEEADVEGQTSQVALGPPAERVPAETLDDGADELEAAALLSSSEAPGEAAEPDAPDEADEPRSPRPHATAAEAKFSPEDLARLRGRHAAVLAGIDRHVPDPDQAIALRAQAEALNPDTWLTPEDVTRALEEYERTYRALRHLVGRPRHRRRPRAGRAASAPATTGSDDTL